MLTNWKGDLKKSPKWLIFKKLSASDKHVYMKKQKKILFKSDLMISYVLSEFPKK